MKSIYFRYFPITLMFALIFMSCDYAHIKKYKVTIPAVNNHNMITKVEVDRMTHALNSIDDIATKHGMSRGEVDRNTKEGLENRVYFAKYNTARTSDKTVKLTVIAINRTGELIIEISDIFRASQSELSKDIERDLINKMKKIFGEGSIVADQLVEKTEISGEQRELRYLDQTCGKIAFKYSGKLTYIY